MSADALRKRVQAHTLALVAALLAWSVEGSALECPAMPQQSQRDIDVAVGIAVGQLGKASGAQLQTQTRTVTKDLMQRLPRADRVYLEQMMYATYCSSLRDNAALTEAERNARIQAYNRELRAMLNPPNPQPAPKVDPRDAARAELARLPVEYTPAAFIKSAEEGKAAVVRLFLQAGMDPNAGDRSGITALMHAADRGDLTMLEMLLKGGAAVNARTRGGGTALSWAAGNGQIRAMQLLLKAGASKESFDDAFLAALRRGHVDAMRLMLDQGANPRADEGATAHMLSLVPRTRAAQLAEILNILLQRGWPVDTRSGDARTGSDQTALMSAALNGDIALVDLLLQAGADVNLHCDCRAILGGGHTALTLASYKGDGKLVQRLLDAGAAVDAPSNGGTPLIVAADAGHTPVIKLLLARGADVNKARNSKGETALMHAAFRHHEMVKLLVSAGADVNAQANNGTTALMWAAEGDQSAIVRLLLDAGAQLETRTQRGRTALMLAVMRGNVDTARLLIQRGARIDVLDEDRRSIMAHAAELKGEDRVRILALLGQKDSK